MIPAAAYYRMSTDRQETSIRDQQKAVEKYARENGYEIVAEYRDEGISGWESTNRKGFSSLIDDAPKGRWRVVLCWDIDRFSRFDPLEANHFWYLLDKAGVSLATVAQGRIDWHDLGGWLSASVQQHGKAQYLRDLSRNVARGILEKKKVGRWLGPAPLGYRLESGRLALGDPAAIALVRRIFAMRASGLHLSDIAKSLNSEGIRTPRGVRWGTVHVATILDRDAYRGAVVIGKHSDAKFSRATDEVIYVENAHPAIIDPQTWATVRAMPKLTRKANGRGGGEGGRLSGLVFCGRCGGPMYCNRVTGGNYYYLCSNYNDGAHKTGVKCAHCAVKRETLEAEVIAKLKRFVFMGSHAALKREIAAVLAERDRPAGSDERRRLKARLAALSAKVEKATSQILLLDSEVVPLAQAKLKELIRERDDCERELHRATTAKAEQPDAAMIAKGLWRIPELLAKRPIPEVRATMQQLVQRIDLTFEHDAEQSTPKRQRYRWTGGTLLVNSPDSATVVRYCLAVCKTESGLIRLDSRVA